MMSMVSSLEYAIFLLGGLACLVYGVIAGIVFFFGKK